MESYRFTLLFPLLLFVVEKKIIGIDEVGYGSWAGPVVVCGVKTYADIKLPLDDSKKISSKKRLYFFYQLIDLHKQGLIHIFLSFGSANAISKEGVFPVTLSCMETVFTNLFEENTITYIDGKNAPLSLKNRVTCIVGGDSKIQAISAASIIAKVYRDHYMRCLSLFYPQYGWDSNVGYGTLHHRSAIKTFGITPHHRLSFKPLQKFRNNF